MKEIIRNLSIQKMAKKIEEKGISCEPTMESVLSNLGALATEITEFGDKKRFISLSNKEIILDMMYPDARISVDLSHDSSFWFATAHVYLEKDDVHPKGEGRFAYTLKEYAKIQHMEEQVAVISIGNWVRGLAKTRAIQSALPFLNLFCDEDIIENENPKPETELPKPTSHNEKHARKTKVIEEKQEIKEVSDTNSVETTTATTSLTLEEAKTLICDIGKCKGHTLGEIHEKQPRNIVWLYNQNNTALKDALKLIIDSDDRLKPYITVA